MQLKNDGAGYAALHNVVQEYFAGRKFSYWFLESNENGINYHHFLLSRRWVFRVGIGEDRGVTLACLELAIGPHYFRPSIFCDRDYVNDFSIDPTIEAVKNNLALLEKFLEGN